ncbi:ParA family protein [Robinsoniella peoriensis]|uniref:ParA family protein n=1 Tax=Robinsoniella peoriensis TaxID=180332 RepID=UPI00085CDAF4|nr:AAA family ATPase [Robinsoniella peoriensis]
MGLRFAPAKSLQLLEGDYDYILIDCMPSLGMLTINAMSAADSVLIPVQPQYYTADITIQREIKKRSQRHMKAK